MMGPRRRKPDKLGVRERPQIRCPAHRAWVRGHECSSRNSNCRGGIEAAHVRTGTDGGLGIKPSDCWTISLCSACHRRQHEWGEAQFEEWTGINMRQIAEALWRKSPAGIKWRKEHDT